MEIKHCPISEWQKIPQGFKLLALSFGDQRRLVKNPNKALQICCEQLIRDGTLTAKVVKELGASWIRPDAVLMRDPVFLTNGIFLSCDGTGVTPLQRISILLKRLGIPQKSCEVEYTVEDVEKDSDLASGRTSALCHLAEWDASSDEPEGSIQKRLHEYTQLDPAKVCPYQVVIGNSKYAVDSWAGFANAFIAYLYLKYKNSPKLLLDLQCSGKWTFGDLIRNDGEELSMLPIAGNMDPKDIIIQILLLIDHFGFDRYSLLVKCAEASNAPSRTPAVSQPTTVPLPKDFNREPSDSVEGENDHQLLCPAEFRCGRHLRPVFSMVSFKEF